MYVHTARRRAGLLAGIGGVAMALAPVLTATSALGDETALIMGGTGLPIPPPAYIDNVNDLYLHCYDGCTTQPVFTPEQLYPASDVKSIPLDESVAQGVDSLNAAIKEQLEAGNDVTVLGYSQSATVATLEMRNIINGTAGIDPEPDQLSFVLLGNPSNPNGGLLERFNLPDDSHPTIPSLGLTFSGATPDTEFDTVIYSAEYDGFSDFPIYPLNLLSVINAVMGIFFVHTQFPEFTPEKVASAVEVPTSDGYDGDTTYYMIPTENLPLLDPLRSIPVVGPLAADLIQPDLKVLVNLGYGDPEFGWVNENADVATPLGLFPSFEDLAEVPELLLQGAVQGVENVIEDLQHPAELFSLDDNPILNLLQTSFLPELSLQTFPIPGLQSIPEAISSAASELYSTLLPLADITTALFTTLPAYDLDLFFDELAEGDLIEAIGLPVAVDVGLMPVAGLFEILAVSEGLAFTAADLISPFVDVAELLSSDLLS